MSLVVILVVAAGTAAAAVAQTRYDTHHTSVALQSEIPVSFPQYLPQLGTMVGKLDMFVHAAKRDVTVVRDVRVIIEALFR